MSPTDLKIVMIHGNGGGTSKDNWFPCLQRELEALGLTVVARDFPDNEAAHEAIWIPFLRTEVQTDGKTIIIGHSSGGVLAMRYAEANKIFGSVLVSVNHTDYNDPTEKESGYYNRPWDWEKIRANQNWIMQFFSTDDPYIPVAESEFVRDRLGTEYFEFSDRGHFMISQNPRNDQFPEIVEALKRKLNL